MPVEERLHFAEGWFAERDFDPEDITMYGWNWHLGKGDAYQRREETSVAA